METKRIVIIGASSGIGLKTAEIFARMGWQLGLAARRTEPLEELSKKFPGQINVASIDVTAQDAVEKFYDLIEACGGMDVCLYSAGRGWFNPELDTADDLQTIDVNVAGFTRIANATFNYFKDTANVTPGRFAAITSVAAIKGLGQCAAYSASKAYESIYLQALDQLAHIRHINMKITEIRPGFISSGFLKGQDEHFPMVMTVTQAAALIVKAILKGKRMATIDSRWKIVSALWRLLPNALWPHLKVDFSK